MTSFKILLASSLITMFPCFSFACDIVEDYVDATLPQVSLSIQASDYLQEKIQSISVSLSSFLTSIKLQQESKNTPAAIPSPHEDLLIQMLHQSIK
jgi:hypothetical protein